MPLQRKSHIGCQFSCAQKFLSVLRLWGILVVMKLKHSVSEPFFVGEGWSVSQTLTFDQQLSLDLVCSMLQKWLYFDCRVMKKRLHGL
jgi:hypothetical protein